MDEIAKSCEECGELFFTRKSRKKYCSEKCQYKHNNRKHHGKRKKYAERPAEWKTERNRVKREATLKKKREVYALLGGKCKCGFEDERALQIDHVHGNGARELKTCFNRNVYYGRVLKSIKAGENKYQLLCANCNWIKRHEKDKL